MKNKPRLAPFRFRSAATTPAASSTLHSPPRGVSLTLENPNKEDAARRRPPLRRPLIISFEAATLSLSRVISALLYTARQTSRKLLVKSNGGKLKYSDRRRGKREREREGMKVVRGTTRDLSLTTDDSRPVAEIRLATRYRVYVVATLDFSSHDA